jgi:very-short-patch-repair endonuclease
LAGKSNPFYGKHHTPETKAAILKTRGPYTGTANPFYGKHHTPETKLKLKNLQPDISGNKNPFWGKKHTQESIIKIKAGQPVLSQENRLKKSKRMANIQARLKKENPELYKEQRARAGKVSLSKQGRYKINKLETKVSDYLKSLGINFEYSTILGHKQFDFGNRESKILIEVQGDYWHGNPEKYSTLNEIQKAIQTKDRAKEQFAYENGFVLFKIWEADVDKNNWEALRGINEIYKLRTNRN